MERERQARTRACKAVRRDEGVDSSNRRVEALDARVTYHAPRGLSCV